jgi:hypothetical protein
MRQLRHIAIVALVGIAVVGCRTVTGQSLGTNIDNTTTTATVKTRLAAERLHNLTWVDVDTNDGVVYLHGTAATQAQKEAAGRIAASTEGVKMVVNSIQVRTAESGETTAAGPVGAVSASPAGTGRHTVTGQVEEIDFTDGTITIQTAAREIELQLPPSALQGVREGDRVHIDVGIRPAQ